VRGPAEWGRVLAVQEIRAGSALAANVSAAATSITVDDAADFDENGGTLLLTDETGATTETKAYSAVDDDTGVITVAALTNGYSQGDAVEVYPAVVSRYATVRLEDVEGEDIYVRIPRSFTGVLPPGVRDVEAGEGESVLVRWDTTDWVLVDIRGAGTGDFATLTDLMSVDGTVTETTVMKKSDLPVPTVGTTYRITLAFKIGTRASAGDTTTLKVKLGSTVVSTHAIPYKASLGGAAIVLWQCIVTVRVSGTSGNAQATAQATARTTTLNSGDSADGDSDTTTGADLTGRELTVTCTWSNGNAANTAHFENGVIEVVQV
jgi:hypothetical protein